MTENLSLITEEEVNASAVTSSPTVLNGTPYENKYVFDKLSKEVIIPKLNCLISSHLEVKTTVNSNSAEIFQNSEKIKDVEASVTANNEEISINKEKIEDVEATVKTNSDNISLNEEKIKELEENYISKNQGTANAGKALVVGADGKITLAEFNGSSSDIIGEVGDNNTITLTGNLADGTYIFKYENSNGAYTDIGTLVIGELVQYSVTANLTNCTPSAENPKVISAGDSATLTFTANEGYALPENIAVNGASYTWDNGTGVLTLSNPTVDVVISIIATKSGYTNIIDTVGYTDGKRLSSNDGVTEKDALEYTLTGMFTVPKDGVVRTKGVNYTSGTYTNAWIYRYDATGEFVTAYRDTTTGLVDVSITNDGNGNLTITNVSGGDKCLRLCGYGSGENLIVTINEEITE